MTGEWTLVVALGVIAIAIRAAGPLLLGDWKPSRRAQRTLHMVAPAILTALVVLQLFTTGQEYRFDARLAGLAAAVVALALRASLMITVVSAVLATVITRALLGQL
ncbi:AzlD domain-containing protein [Streptomyces lavendofoliae]|uniref:AzlD domain-containing protein n=1 Tax=Streptomyces lavendofoliae TaxID=67314 RepID=UPI00300E7CEF